MRKRDVSIKNIKKYFGVFKGVRLPWILIILCLIFSILMMRAELQVATLTADIIDASQNAINGSVLFQYVGMAVLAAVCTILSNYFTRKMEEVINLRVRMKLWSKIMRLPTKYYDKDNGNELVTRVTSDAESPSSLFTLAISFVVCLVTTLQAFSQLFDYNVTLAKYALGVIPLTLAICIFYGVVQFKIGVYITATMAGSLGYIAERIRNFRLIKSALAERTESVKGNQTFKEMYKANLFDWMLVAGYQLASGLINIMFIVLVFVIGGQLLPSGEVTIGDLTGFYMVTNIVSIQLMQFFMNVGSVSGTFGTMKKIASISDMDSEADTGAAVPLACSDIVFDHVSFSYSQDQPVLQDLSLRIPKGKVTAIIGGNGAGKSTLFKLLTRLYEPEQGQIRFGEDGIEQYQLSAWRDRFACVFQKDPLIGGTVRDNITYGLDREVSDEELIAVAKQANCYDFIMEKPEGFNEDVGLGGSNFSGGQGQCISIARAMLRNADYLLLDEATSNLDVVSEAAVTEAMNRLMKDRTTILIAHNYAATSNADYVVVMKDGTVEAAGTPAELLQSNGYYQMFCKTV